LCLIFSVLFVNNASFFWIRVLFPPTGEAVYGRETALEDITVQSGQGSVIRKAFPDP
jgi:hypothetical protein